MDAFLGEPEVSQPQVALVVQEDVLGLEVPNGEDSGLNDRILTYKRFLCGGGTGGLG